MIVAIMLMLSMTVNANDARADAVVTVLYDYVVAHHLLGIPTGTDKTALWPLLSARLVNELETARACEQDYQRQHPSDTSKPAYGWLETGLFSGSDEQALPSKAVVERTVPQKDGTVRVYIRLEYREPRQAASAAFHWKSAAVVKFEAGRWVIDDVLVLENDSAGVASRLSQTFVGCNGPRWVGHHK